MGKLTINLCEELHQKIREDVAADESLTTSLLMERIIREHYEGPKPRPRIESGGRTMAFSVSEELFQRVKRYLAAHGGQSQRDFVIGLVTQGLALWEQGKALKMLEGYTPQKGDRTLAFAVTEELFHQIKAYLAAHKKLSQKEFMVSLVENAVSAWEAGAEADGSPIVEVLPELKSGAAALTHSLENTRTPKSGTVTGRNRHGRCGCRTPYQRRTVMNKRSSRTGGETSRPFCLPREGRISIFTLKT